MQTVQNGLFVSVDYKGTLQNGEVFDTSHGCRPLEVEMGAGHLIQGFEAALLGMALNEKKTIVIGPEQAYGPRNEDHIYIFDRADVPPEMDPEVGETVALTSPDGHEVPARITAVDAEKVTVDLNHPLAGETLTFEIQVVGISATPTQPQDECGCGCSCGSDDHCA